MTLFWPNRKPRPKLLVPVEINMKFCLHNQASSTKKKTRNQTRGKKKKTNTTNNGSQAHRGLSALRTLQSRVLKERLRYLHQTSLTTQGFPFYRFFTYINLVTQTKYSLIVKFPTKYYLGLCCFFTINHKFFLCFWGHKGCD